MARHLAKIRSKAFDEQDSRCYYCGYRMWLGSISEYASLVGVSGRQALQLRCTAEHLHARSEGGGDVALNIVAACWACNSRRHRRSASLTPDDYKALVLKRLKVGRWHSQGLEGAM
jgi:5-methylcytosine-specific restriction endonuclease McrA